MLVRLTDDGFTARAGIVSRAGYRCDRAQTCEALLPMMRVNRQADYRGDLFCSALFVFLEREASQSRISCAGRLMDAIQGECDGYQQRSGRGPRQ
jgi:hypothetical protein